MFVERAKLFLAKYKIFKVIAILVIICGVLYGILQFYLYFYSSISETSKGIIGTLLGAVVGGCFTLAGSVIVNKRAQKAANEIRRKNTIYKPLYDELIDIHSIILKENQYPRYIEFQKMPQTISRHPQYTAWGRIKTDTRIFEVPRKLKDKMEKLYEAIALYQKNHAKAVAALDRIYREEIQIVTKQQRENIGNAGETLLPDVLLGNKPNNDHLMWFNDRDNNAAADAIWERLQQRAKRDEDLNDCIQAWIEWNKAEEDVLKLLGVYIQYITAKYEG